MARPTDPDEPQLLDLHGPVEAERAAVEHWRRVALQREAEYTALTTRPAVRALLGVERRLAPLGRTARAARRRLAAATAQAALRAGALRRAARPPSPALLATRLPAAPGPLDRSVTVAVVGTSDAERPPSPCRGVEVISVTAPEDVRAALGHAIRSSAPQLVGVVAATTEPVDATWLARLAGAIAGDVVAAAPMVVHPRRPRRRATAHDGMVRAAGVRLELDDDGAPHAVPLLAGTMPDPQATVSDVDAATGAAVLVDRTAYEAAGGLVAADDLDAAVIELCGRLRADGGRVVVVPGAVAVDRRRVASRRDLQYAADPASRGWSAAVDRSGPVLRRVADPQAHPPLRLALTTAVPSGKLAARWGDWHLAEALAGSLRRLGHAVLVQSADRADDLSGRSCDVHVVLRGLRPVRRTAGQRHVLWIISHPEAVGDDELAAADLVLVASPRFADHLRGRTDTPVEVLLQATDHRRFAPRPVEPAHRHDLTIVAKTRDVLRPAVADALAAGLRPRIYGGGWQGLVDPDLVVANHVDNDVLPVVYSSAGVVLNDHWGTMRAWGFVSNRIFDVLACGTPVISDPVDGLAELLDGAVLEYHSTEELRRLVDDVLADPGAARDRAARGRRIVLERHTMDHRARELLDAISRCAGG